MNIDSTNYIEQSATKYTNKVVCESKYLKMLSRNEVYNTLCLAN